MNNIQDAKQALEQLFQKDKFDRMLHTAAILTELLLPHGVRPIIVGGLSVEIYTLSGYTTQDIDLVMDGYELANDLLNQIGFTKVGKDWVHAALGVSIEIPSNFLAGDYEKVTEVPIGERKVFVIGIEDIILDRLRAAVHWSSGESREWGYRMLLMYYEELDIPYFFQKFETRSEQTEFELWITEALKEKGTIDKKEPT
ncbi:DUF6036 family nucleotidyltransferase [Paenibacillus sp. SN-8-1]|uniref:DUF6036 family nucleotidyltransferase n=1 Tax=Paenibacillus sp. SN-8-1 TaxID=3435409 RepID=UPI003D9AA984